MPLLENSVFSASFQGTYEMSSLRFTVLSNPQELFFREKGSETPINELLRENAHYTALFLIRLSNSFGARGVKVGSQVSYLSLSSLKHIFASTHIALV